MKISSCHFLHSFYRTPCTFRIDKSRDLVPKYSSSMNTHVRKDRASDVFACASADVRNATAAAEYAALQRAPRQRVCVRIRAVYPVDVCVCPCVFLRVCFRTCESVSVCASERTSGAGNIADETRAADASPISPRKNLTLPLYDPRYARRFEMQIVWDVVALATWKLHPALATRKILKTQREGKYSGKKICGNHNPAGREEDGFDPCGNISWITSARFVDEILITFSRHQGGKVCV